MKTNKGRPSKFNVTLEKIAITLAEKGHIDREIAEIVEVSESALNEHKKRKPEFHESLRKAKEQFDNEIVESALLKRAVGMTIKEVQVKTVEGKQIKTIIEKELPPDSTALTLYLRNRMPEKYNKEKQTHSFEIKNYKSLTVEEAKTILQSDPFLQETAI